MTGLPLCLLNLQVKKYKCVVTRTKLYIFFSATKQNCTHVHFVYRTSLNPRVVNISECLVAKRSVSRDGDSGASRTHQWDISNTDPRSIIR